MKQRTKEIVKIVRGLIYSMMPPIIENILVEAQAMVRRPFVKYQMAQHDKLHLAAGNNVIKGWANIDRLRGKGIISWDLTRPLPLDAGTIRYIYCEHFIEHINLADAYCFIQECYRVLEENGVLRVSTPSLRKLTDEYLQGTLGEWIDVGFEPATPCQLMNEGMRLWGHQFVYDREEMEKMLRECGFRTVTSVPWRESQYEIMNNLECRPFHGEIIMEGVK